MQQVGTLVSVKSGIFIIFPPLLADCQLTKNKLQAI